MRGAGLAAKTSEPYQKRRAIPEVVLAVAFLTAGIWLYAAHLPPETNLVNLQWSTAVDQQTLAGIRLHPADFRVALEWDMWALIPGYLIGLFLACHLGSRVFWMPRPRTLARLAMAMVVLAAACNWAHDPMLMTALSRGLQPSALLEWAEVLSFVKFAALLVAGSVGLVAIIITIGRLAGSQATKNSWGKAITACGDRDRCEGRAPDERPLVIPPPVIEDAASRGSQATGRPIAGTTWWKRHSTGQRARWAQGFASPSRRPEGAVGVCVSGGGIRSAAVALGALQALRESTVLGRADYLVSVSGGGYTAGGMQLAMTKPAEGEDPSSRGPVSQADAKDVFAPGSPEEDHLRRHSSYIADGLGQWVIALGVLLRNVLSSLVVIGLTITTFGLAIGAFYHGVPITAGGKSPPPPGVGGQGAPGAPSSRLPLRCE